MEICHFFTLEHVMERRFLIPSEITKRQWNFTYGKK